MKATLNSVPTAAANVKPTPKVQLWTGRVLSGIAVLFLIFDAVIKVINIQPVVDSSMELGLPLDLAPVLGSLMLICLVIYLVPRTAVLGAVLITGYLGGAIAIQARIDAPLFSLIFPIIIGTMIWAGLYLRDRRLREFVAHR